MAGGNKKKKTKPTANPARGFATTSLPKANKPVSDPSTDEANASGAATPDTTAPPSVASQNNRADEQKTEKQRELHELSPEELEAQLEASDLQQFVEQNAAKVRKESARQASRLETDKRVLRGQADFLSVKDWLPDELMQQILDHALAEQQSESTGSRKSNFPVGDDLLSKVWILRNCLLELEIPSSRVNDILGYVVANPPAQDNSGLAWGLSSALDWMSIHCAPGELHDYDYQKPKVVVEELVTEEEPTKSNGSEFESKKQESSSTNGARTTNPAEEIDLDVSDVDSDVEPDELLAVYLRTRAKLYELNPAIEESSGKKKGPTKGKTPAQPNMSSGQKKLQQKLQKFEGDVLFDQREAEAQWAEKKVGLARETAERRRFQLSQEGNQQDKPAEIESEKSNGIADEAEKLGLELLKESEDQEDGEMLGGMFDALPGIQESSAGDGSGSQPSNVTVRDFGRMSGMSPKRIFEETCKARDSQVKIAYKMVSPTTYASRHSLTLSWSKDQEALDSGLVPA
ncbi:hypothetical protein KC322_g10044, partial [Hortaea werneckii]